MAEFYGQVDQLSFMTQVLQFHLFFSFCQTFHHFSCACQQQSMLNYLSHAPYQFFSFCSWQFFLLAFSKILCAPFLYLLLDLNLILETCVKRAERKLLLPLWEEVPLPFKHMQRIFLHVFYSSFFCYASINRVKG